MNNITKKHFLKNCQNGNLKEAKKIFQKHPQLIGFVKNNFVSGNSNIFDYSYIVKWIVKIIPNLNFCINYRSTNGPKIFLYDKFKRFKFLLKYDPKIYIFNTCIEKLNDFKMRKYLSKSIKTLLQTNPQKYLLITNKKLSYYNKKQQIVKQF